MAKIVPLLSNFIKFVGAQSAWLNLLLILIICFDVLQRYLFNQSHNMILELEWHFFGLIFLLGSAYTLQMDKHVRVDVFYNNFSEKKKGVVDLLGTLFLLIPWCVVGISTCYNYASNSFYIKEQSPNPGGLPAWYVIKYFIVLSFVLLFIQACIIIYEKIKLLTK